MTALVFGQADPKDFTEPVCQCGHERRDHADSEGAPPEPAKVDDESFCWAGWEYGDEGCDCICWRPA